MKAASAFKFLYLPLIASILSISLAITATAPVVYAEPVTDFDPGMIIEDGVFYNRDAMTVGQIQTFLDTQIPNCDINGTQPATYFGYPNLTRAQYAQQIAGWPGPPYVCLNKYFENPITNETSYEKGGGAFIGGIGAAQIIYDSAQQYNINPQVLLVMLRKESAGPLTADPWPLKSQYKYAMGYACPDSGANYSAACEDSKAGFYKQMTLAAWQLKYYKDHPNDFRYALGWNNIQYNPDPSCGTKSVNIQNIATLSLYIYTPYTPNDAALAAYPGQAVCGSYGNRNFFAFFKEWFGASVFSFRHPTERTTSAGDVSGDGKADMTLLYDYGNAWTKAWTLYGDGTKFAPPVVTWDSGKWNFDANRATWTTGDFNGDGKTDITALYDYGNAEVKFWTLYSTVVNFSSATATY